MGSGSIDLIGSISEGGFGFNWASNEGFLESEDVEQYEDEEGNLKATLSLGLELDKTVKSDKTPGEAASELAESETELAQLEAKKAKEIQDVNASTTLTSAQK